ncbi:hypothetical protein CRUP_019392 [Coryphaenoides rupestris]|nr:hypothetical protein CRUP_019392 [Coryphaenoides rupestris]
MQALPKQSPSGPPCPTSQTACSSTRLHTPPFWHWLSGPQPAVTATPSEPSSGASVPLTLTAVIQPRKGGCSRTEGAVRRSGEAWSSGATPPTNVWLNTVMSRRLLFTSAHPSTRPSTSSEVFRQSRRTRTACQRPSLTATAAAVCSSAGSAQKMEKRRRRRPRVSSSSRKSQKPSSSRLKLSTLSQQAFHTGKRPHWPDTPPNSSTSPWASHT